MPSIAGMAFHSYYLGLGIYRLGISNNNNNNNRNTNICIL